MKRIHCTTSIMTSEPKPVFGKIIRPSAVLAVGIFIAALGVILQSRQVAAVPLPEWSNDARDITPSGRVFLGQFSNQTVSLLLSGLPTHSQVTVSFDLFVINSWDGNDLQPEAGPDIWDLTVAGGPTLLHTTFSNCGQNQAYPDTFPGGDNPGGTGASEVFTLGYGNCGDSVYHLTFTFPHSISAVQFDFSATGIILDISDESWGLDNVEVAVDGNIVYSNDFESSISATNDDFDAATTISSLPFSDLVNTTAATTAPDDPTSCVNSHSVWYSFTPATEMTIEANSFGSNYFAVVSAWTGSRGSLIQVACGGDQVVFDATAGTTYYFMVGGNSGGLLRFSVRSGLNVDLTVDPNGKLERVGGTATISGTVRCSETSGVELSGELRQRAGRFTVIVGSFSQGMGCSPSPTPWSATISGGNAPFGPGRASANIFAFGCGTANCDGDNVINTVRFKGNPK